MDAETVNQLSVICDVAVFVLWIVMVICLWRIVLALNRIERGLVSMTRTCAEIWVGSERIERELVHVQEACGMVAQALKDQTEAAERYRARILAHKGVE